MLTSPNGAIQQFIKTLDVNDNQLDRKVPHGFKWVSNGKQTGHHAVFVIVLPGPEAGNTGRVFYLPIWHFIWLSTHSMPQHRGPRCPSRGWLMMNNVFQESTQCFIAHSLFSNFLANDCFFGFLFFFLTLADSIFSVVHLRILHDSVRHLGGDCRL